MNDEQCPCLSGKTYLDCCGPLHKGQYKALTAEQLMRSRYSAFVKADIDYLLKTLHPSSHQPDEKAQLTHAVQTTQWLGLQILDSRQATNKAEVEFVAFYADKPFSQLHERSAFLKEQDQWFYVTGEFLADIKLNRNAACFCGSGNKFKRCHGK